MHVAVARPPSCMGCRNRASATRSASSKTRSASRLFVRDGRDMLLSDAGAEFLEHAQRIKESCEGARSGGRGDAPRDRRHADHRLDRRVRHLVHLGTAFRIQAEISAGRRRRHIPVDRAISSRPSGSRPSMASSTGASRPISTTSPAGSAGLRSALYASPRLIEKRGQPRNACGAGRPQGIAFREPTGLQSWHLEQGEETVDALPPSALCTANDYWMLKYFAVAGEGIVYLPAFFTEIECMHWRSWCRCCRMATRRKSRSICFTCVGAMCRANSRPSVDFCLDYLPPARQHSTPRYCVEVSVRPQADPLFRGENDQDLVRERAAAHRRRNGAHARRHRRSATGAG